MKKTIFLLIVSLQIVSVANIYAQGQLTQSQQKQFVSNLNYLQYSIGKIKSSDNKAIADEEYYAVINNRNLETISNKQLNMEYGSFLDNCAHLKLKQNEKDFIKQLNDKAQKKAYLSAFSNFGTVFVSGQSPQQIVASLVYTSVANAFAVANQKNQLNTQLEKDMFYLNQDIMQTIYNMQSTLFTTSASLLGGQSAEGRINEDSMNTFIAALKLDAKERKNALNEPGLKKNLDAFPPLWFELGNAYQETGDYASALKCYSQFESLKKYDVVDKDYNYVKLLKNKIKIYIGDDSQKALENAQKNKKNILSCIETLKSNYLDSDAGEKNLYLARIYYLIGDTNESLKCLQYLIDSKTMYPEYIEEALELKSLIKSSLSLDQSPFYQYAFNYTRIQYGNTSKSVIETLGEEKNIFASAIDWGKGLLGKNVPYLDYDHFCFEIPNTLLANYSISVKLGNKLYVPEIVKEQSYSKSLCVVDYEIDDLEDVDSFVIQFDSKNDNNSIEVEFAIMPFAAKYYHAAEKAYNRIGSDVFAHNAQKAVEFGEAIYSYKYQVSDVEDLNNDIRKKWEKIGRKENKTKEEINSGITKEFFEKLSPDISFLQERCKAIEQSYYKKKDDVLYSPAIAQYGGKYFLIGISSIADTKTNKTVSFDVNNEIVKKEDTPISKAEYSLECYRDASIGDIPSMVQLATAYLEGYGVKKDEREAVRWLLKVAAKQETNSKDKLAKAQAYKQLGICYYEGVGVKKNSSNATIWFNKAKEYGFEIDPKYFE